MKRYTTTLALLGALAIGANTVNGATAVELRGSSATWDSYCFLHVTPPAPQISYDEDQIELSSWSANPLSTTTEDAWITDNYFPNGGIQYVRTGNSYWTTPNLTTKYTNNAVEWRATNTYANMHAAFSDHGLPWGAGVQKQSQAAYSCDAPKMKVAISGTDYWSANGYSFSSAFDIALESTWRLVYTNPNQNQKTKLLFVVECRTFPYSVTGPCQAVNGDHHNGYAAQMFTTGRSGAYLTDTAALGGALLEPDHTRITINGNTYSPSYYTQNNTMAVFQIEDLYDPADGDYWVSFSNNDTGSLSCLDSLGSHSYDGTKVCLYDAVVSKY